ncbi:MAG: alcohol dehydrogenase catalytic domain-containing protein [Deltaproteobacteria bacterium]|nr:alcohol dehydrogenase catalytic domain-containing protein [Deltaproteobacteria bacterium]
MKALVYYRNRDIRLEDVPQPEPGPDELLIKVTDAGLCQTQVNEFIEGPFIINTKPNPVTGKAIPLIAGHEFGGVVDAAGSEGSQSLVGTRVAVLPLLNCKTCEWCRSGKEHLCNSMAYYGLIGADGGFAEYAVVRTNNVLPVSDPAIITFVEPLLVALHAVAKIKSDLGGCKVLVMGAGAIGTAMASVLTFVCKAAVSITDILSKRRQRAKAAGFHVIEKDALSQCFDIVIDCAGSDPYSGKHPAILEGCQYLLKGGTLLVLGTYFHPLAFVPVQMLINEYMLINSYLYNNADVVSLKETITSLKTDFSLFIDDVPLKRIIEDGYYRAEVDKDSFTRLVVKC